MGLVMNGPHIVTSYHTSDAANSSPDDVIIERFVGSSKHPPQEIINRLMGKTYDGIAFLTGYFDFIRAFGKIFNCRFHNLFSSLNGIVIVKLDMPGPANFGFRRGRDNFGMIALGNIMNGLH